MDNSKFNNSFDQTRRCFGGLQPLCGIGVVSHIRLTSNPVDCKARKAASRPGPGPLTLTSTFRIPWSAAFLATSTIADWAAKGVLLREPLKPRQPALVQATALPILSVMLITVLLNVEKTKTIPSGIFFFSFRATFLDFFSRAIVYKLPFNQRLTQLRPYFFRTAALLGPFLVLALVRVRCPLHGNPLRCRKPL